MVVCARSVGWGGMKIWHCCVSYLVQVHWCAVCKHKFQTLIHTTDQLCIHTADNCLLPLLFLRFLSILSCSPIITYVFASKIWICVELNPWLIIHILCFITPNCLPICLIIVVTWAIFQVWDWVGVYLGRSGTGRCCATCSQYPLASELFSSSISKSSWNYSSQCGIIPLCQVLQEITSVLVAVFIRQYSSVIRNIASVPSVQSYSHTVVLHADRRQCHLLLNTCIFACWVTGLLYHNVTGMFF